MCWSRGWRGQGLGPQIELHKALGFFNGHDPLENHKATIPAFNVGHHQTARKTPFK